MKFRFPHDETTKLGPQRITVKSSDASLPPLLAVLSIGKGAFKVRSLGSGRVFWSNRTGHSAIVECMRLLI